MPASYGCTRIAQVDKLSLTCPLGAPRALDIWVKNKNTNTFLPVICMNYLIIL